MKKRIVRQARMSHHCDECKGTITLCDKYSSFTFNEGDGFYQMKQCSDCDYWYRIAWNYAKGAGMFGEELPGVGGLIEWLEVYGDESGAWAPNPTKFHDIRSLVGRSHVLQSEVREAIRLYNDPKVPLVVALRYIVDNDKPLPRCQLLLDVPRKAQYIRDDMAMRSSGVHHVDPLNVGGWQIDKNKTSPLPGVLYGCIQVADERQNVAVWSMSKIPSRYEFYSWSVDRMSKTLDQLMLTCPDTSDEYKAAINMLKGLLVKAVETMKDIEAGGGDKPLPPKQTHEIRRAINVFDECHILSTMFNGWLFGSRLQWYSPVIDIESTAYGTRLEHAWYQFRVDYTRWLTGVAKYNLLYSNSDDAQYLPGSYEFW